MTCLRLRRFLICILALVAGQAMVASGQKASAPPASSKAEFDGPAELPRGYVQTSLEATPAPGKVNRLSESSNLQQALDSAACGDVIELPAGSSFTGRFRIPRKPCDDGHWIIIRTAGFEALPHEGTRVSPCYAGVSSLPARPDFHCDTPKNVMARIAFAGKGGAGPLMLSDGANHIRLIGLEITREAPGRPMSALISPEQDAAADHIILDRIWAHGTAQDETTRGLFLSGLRYVGVVDSYFSDFHCISRTGACTDAQTIAGGGGSHPMGPFKIVNNFLEASGENIIFGGSAATETPADIEIRHNHLFKAPIWMPGSDGFVGSATGSPFIVKNLIEFKNAQRVLFEGNVLENSWGGFSQAGFAIVLTPKNQSPNVCPLCRVNDITIRYNKISHVAGALLIANVASDTGGIATAGERYSIHDLLFDDIDGEKYHGFGVFLLLMQAMPPLRDVHIDHITAMPPRVFMNIGVPAEGEKPSRFSLTNSILNAGEREITSTGNGPKGCAFQAQRRGATDILRSCFSSIAFAKNAIIGGDGGWPKDNFYPKNASAVGFVDYRDGKGGDYRLCRGKDEPAPPCRGESKYVNAGTDGKDLGADITAIDAATRNVF